jgi:thymidine kinase
MFSQKTTSMLSMLERYKHQRKVTLVFKPAIDDRYDQDNIVSHSGWSVPAITVITGADILGALTAHTGTVDAVFIDEAFMIPGVASATTWLYRQGINVIVSTLDMSATLKPFVEVEKMMPWASDVKKCSAVCTVCGQDAHFTYKKPVDIDQGEIQVGGAELYEPRCWSHHPSVSQ